MSAFPKNLQYYKFCAYGFLKNLRFFDPYLLLFFREMGISYFEIGILFSVREIAKAILEIPSGVWADSFGRKNAMLLCFTAYIVSFLIFYFLPHFGIYALAMIFFAAGEAFRSGTHKAMIFGYLKIKNLSHLRTDYYGHTRSWSQRGSALSALIAGALVFYSGSYRIIFLATIIPYIMELLLMASYPQALNKVGSGTQKKRPRRQDFFRFLKRQDARRGILNSAFYDGFFKAVKDYLQPLLKSFALSLPIMLALEKQARSAIIIAMVYFLIYLATAYASQNSARLATRFQHLPRATNICFGLGIGMTLLSGLFYHWHYFAIAIVLFIALYILQNLRRPMIISYISNTIPDDAMATGLSVESQIKTLATAVLAPLIGYLADHLGVGWAIALTAGLLLVSFPFVRLTPTPTRS